MKNLQVEQIHWLACCLFAFEYHPCKSKIGMAQRNDRTYHPICRSAVIGRIPAEPKQRQGLAPLDQGTDMVNIHMRILCINMIY